MGFSVLLMAMFGWQGATCIDEWTMAACNLAMGATLMLAGSGALRSTTCCFAATRAGGAAMVPLGGAAACRCR